MKYVKYIREKGITTLRIDQYWIFYHTIIETCFENDMLKSSEHKKSWRYIYIPQFFRLFWRSWPSNFILLLNSKNRNPCNICTRQCQFGFLPNKISLKNHIKIWWVQQFLYLLCNIRHKKNQIYLSFVLGFLSWWKRLYYYIVYIHLN